jgi:hypothetical protein
MRLTGLFAIFLVAGCTSLQSAPGSVLGSWGGTHVGLVLDGSGGRLEYDCASGTTAPVISGPNGRFQVEGSHTPAAGGPEIEGQVRPTYHARFSGRARGDRMTLTGRLENGVVLGPFELRRGAEPIIFRCL